jgi:hypothetical protein
MCHVKHGKYTLKVEKSPQNFNLARQQQFCPKAVKYGINLFQILLEQYLKRN